MNLSAELIEQLNLLPPEIIYQWFASMFPAETVKQMDVMLLKGSPPEYLFQLPSAASIPQAIKDVTLKALYWRKGKLIATAPLN